MSPPPYSDLGKKAKDVFSKGYHFGLIKLDCKTTTAHGVQFNTGGVSDQESGKVTGSLESKYTVKDYGLTFTEKWSTSNTLGTEVSMVDQGLKGLKLTAGINFSPQEGLQSGVAKAGFQNDRVALNADADLTTSNQIVQASAVVGHQGWLAGYQGAFDVQNSKLTKSNFALGFSTKDFILHTQVDKADEETEEKQIFVGSIYQKLSQKLTAGINVMWKQCGGEAGFDLGCSYELDGDATVRAKVDNKVQVGLSYTQRLREVDGVPKTVESELKTHTLDIHTYSDDGQLFSGAIYQQINPKLETGINLSWATSGEKTVFGLGAKYNLDQDAALRAKINNSSQIGLGYQQRLRDGVTLTLSTLIDGKNFNQGGHKVGLAVELEA